MVEDIFLGGWGGREGAKFQHSDPSSRGTVAWFTVANAMPTLSVDKIHEGCWGGQKMRTHSKDQNRCSAATLT